MTCFNRYCQLHNKFWQYQTNITKMMECLASPLPVDIAACFNATYHAPLQESQEVKTLLSDINRPANIDMIVRPTNSDIYTLKDHAMYAIRNVDACLQEVHATIANSSYVNMKLAEEMMQANTEGLLPQKPTYWGIQTPTPPPKGQNKLCITPSLLLLFNPGTVANFNCCGH